MAIKKILIVGATGKQGGAAIEAILASPRSSDFRILALTRDASSASAKKLASNPQITVVEGDSTNPAPIFAAHKPIHGVFCMTAIGKVAEEKQANTLIDASVANGVEQFVFTSVERGGPEVSDKTPTNVPHFASKYNIEEHLKIKCASSDMTYTILRPVAFMDNLTPDFMGKGFASMWAGVGSKPLQLISSRDIGLFAARAFLNPEAYKGRSISLAGDELNLEQAKKVFKETLGYEMPETMVPMGTIIRLVSRDMKLMCDFFANTGFGADIKALKKEEPKLQTFAMWLRESSKFEEK